MIPRDSSERRSLRPRLRLVAILLAALMVALVVGNRGVMRLHQLYRAKAALAREIEQLSAGNAALSEEVQALRRDPGRVETIAREELGLVKPGEMVYEFPSASRPSGPGDAR